MTFAYDIDPRVPAAIESFRLPERLGFGQVSAPVMFDAHCESLLAIQERRAPDPLGWTKEVTSA